MADTLQREAELFEYRTLDLLAAGDDEGLKQLLGDLHPTEAANLLVTLPLPELRVTTFRLMQDELAAEVLERLGEADLATMLDLLTASEVSEAVAEMDPDDAADFVADLPDEHREQVLSGVPTEQQEAIRDLLRYPEDTAGGRMTPEVTALPKTMTAAEAIAQIRRMADSEEEIIYYVCVVDEKKRLMGVLSLRQLLLQPSSRRLEEFIETDVLTVQATTDQEEVARLMKEYSYLALPVVDADQRLLGLVTVDDILSVIHEEQSEDVQKMVGAGGDERVDSPLSLSIRRRLPWLQINLVSVFLAGAVVSLFEDLIARVTILAAFMPVIANEAGNTGQQTLAVVMRSVVLQEPASRRIRRVLSFEVLKALINGLIVASTAGVAAYFFAGRDLVLGGVVTVAMLVSMLWAGTVGACVPLVMRRLGVDPAQSSTIFLTTSSDIASFAILLGLAALAFGVFH
jgi:magnesium transporter